MKIRTLIVDDETIARERLRRLLADEPDIEIIGEARNGREAVALIRQLAPELVLLDVQMPEMTGFAALAEIGSEGAPAIIFITAHDQFALQAFEVHALDYLLKPVTRERLQRALAHARVQIEARRGGRMDARLRELLDGLRVPPRYLERLVVKSGGRVYFVKVEEIDWVEAAGNYVNLHVGNETHLLRETMGHLETRLDPQRFVRIHRSTLVHLDRIKELQPLFNGDYTVILRNGAALTLSRTYRDRLLEVISDR
jgi:two-component system LytT family response regulator